MRKTGVILVAIWVLSYSAFSQNAYRHALDQLVLELKEPTAALDRLIAKAMPDSAKKSDTETFHIYILILDSSARKKKFFEDSSFLSFLRPYVHKVKRKEVLHTWTMIRVAGKYYDSGDGKVYYYPNQEVMADRVTMLRLFKARECVIAFMLTYCDMSFVFAASPRGMMVFKQSLDEVKVFTLREFVSCCWESSRIASKN